MRTWLLDTNIILYLLTREDQLDKARQLGPEPERHLRTLYASLDRFIAERLSAGDRFLLTPIVIQETLNVLQYAEVFSLGAQRAAEVLLALIQAQELECEERERMAHALERQAAGEAPFADAYLACRVREGEDMRLLTNDRGLHDAAGGRAVLLRQLPGS
jgi:predicted nucleic acid-binding protein